MDVDASETAPGNWGGTCTFGSMENALKVRDIAAWLEAWAPRHLAESYDNVGLLVGSADMEVDKVADMVVQLSSRCKNSQKNYTSQRSKNSFKKVKIV